MSSIESPLAARRPAAPRNAFRGDLSEVPHLEITDASFRDGVVAFSVVRKFKGSIERTSRDGGDPVKREWTATRVK